jgi:FG-GAP-like repeat
MLKRATALAATLALAAPAAAHAGFKQPVKVLWQHTGDPGRYYAWAVAPLRDIDRDGADDVIAGEVGVPGSDDPGVTWVQSGRSGRVLHRFVGNPGDQNGFAIADAGDVDRDGVHDVLSGAPRQNGDTEGHAYLYSGRTGSLLHAFAGEVSGDSFGSAVTSADVNRDGRPDLVVGAASHPGGGLAYVFSGRTFKLLYKIPPPDPDHAFGFGAGTTPDVDRDHVPDLIVGGGGAAYVLSGRDGHVLYPLPPSAAPRQFGTFFLAGVGDVNHDHVPDVYGADYAAGDNGPNSGYAGVYSGRDGTLLHSWSGAAGDGLGPGRGALDVNFDRVDDLAVGSYLNSDGGLNAGKIQLFSGRSGRRLRTITSTTPGENLGFDAVGIRDLNRDHRPDLLASAAEGDTLYVIAGR